MVSGLFVEEPDPPALIEKKDAIVRVIDQKAENFSKEIVVKGFTKADKKVLIKSETSGKIIDLPITAVCKPAGSFVNLAGKNVAEFSFSLDSATKTVKSLFFSTQHDFVTKS